VIEWRSQQTAPPARAPETPWCAAPVAAIKGELFQASRLWNAKLSIYPSNPRDGPMTAGCVDFPPLPYLDSGSSYGSAPITLGSHCAAETHTSTGP
jgi:hypothetical protein